VGFAFWIGKPFPTNWPFTPLSNSKLEDVTSGCGCGCGDRDEEEFAARSLFCLDNDNRKPSAAALVVVSASPSRQRPPFFLAVLAAA
jgi:hypothetical protein